MHVARWHSDARCQVAAHQADVGLSDHDAERIGELRREFSACGKARHGAGAGGAVAVVRGVWVVPVLLASWILRTHAARLQVLGNLAPFCMQHTAPPGKYRGTLGAGTRAPHPARGPAVMQGCRPRMQTPASMARTAAPTLPRAPATTLVAAARP